MATFLESLKARQDSALSAAADMTDEEQAIAKLLAEVEAREEQTRVTLALRRKMDLDVRCEAAQARAPKGVTCRPVDLEESAPGAGTYIVRTPTLVDMKDHMDRLSAASKSGGTVDLIKLNADLAVDCCVDPDCQDPDIAAEVRAKLNLYPGAGLTIGNVCTELAGLATVERKSRR